MKNLISVLKKSTLIVLSAVFALAAAGPASAADDFYGPGLWHSEGGHRTFYGAYRTIDGASSYCLDAGLPSPRPGHFAGSKPKTVRSPQTAWLLAQYSSSTSSHRQAALASFVKLDEKLPHRHTMKVRQPKDLGAKFKPAAELFSQMKKDAEKFAGPYELSLEPKQRDGAVFVTPILTSASGAQLKKPVDIAITGGEDDVKKKVDSGTEVSVAAQPGSRVKIEARAAGLPGTDVRVYTPTDGARVQNVTTGAPTEVTAEAIADTQLPYAPQARTRAQLTDDGTVVDAIEITGAEPKSELTVKARAYHSADEPVQSTELQGELVDEQELTVRADDEGAAELTTEPVEAQPGWTTWTVEIIGADGWDGWISEWGIPDETVFCEQPPTPEEAPPAELTPPPTDEPAEAPAPETAAPTQPDAEESAPAPAAGGTAAPREKPEAVEQEQLPRTGAEWKIATGTGLMLLGVGSAALVLARRRA